MYTHNYSPLYILDDEINIPKDDEDYKTYNNKLNVKEILFGVWKYYDECR